MSESPKPNPKSAEKSRQTSPTQRAGTSTPSRQGGASPTRQGGASPTRQGKASPTRQGGVSPTRQGTPQSKPQSGKKVPTPQDRNSSRGPAEGSASAKGRDTSLSTPKADAPKDPAAVGSEFPVNGEMLRALLAEKGLPEGCSPLFLASKTQEMFTIITDKHVTGDQPFKILKKDDVMLDIKARAAVSDFQPMKKAINDYPGEEILMIYDHDFKFGQNFIIVLNESSKETILKPPPEPKSDENDEEEEDYTEYTYVPPVSKKWESFGSEKEVDEATVVPTRPLIQMQIAKVRRSFGAPISFSDKNVDQIKNGYTECASYEDKQYSGLSKIELEKGVQAAAAVDVAGTQTHWSNPRNAQTQTKPREFTEEECTKALADKELAELAQQSRPKFEEALQQNEIFNIFVDDYVELEERASAIGSKADNHLKEYQSFADLKNSKGKVVTCIDWHPVIRGLLGMSVAHNFTFDQRIDNAPKLTITPSYILLWSFADPIKPQLLLEAPDDIHVFRFCPTNPAVIAGGCHNGQIVLWDIDAHLSRLKTVRQPRNKKNPDAIAGFEEAIPEVPAQRYCAVSNIDHGHKAPITDLIWLPDHMELNKLGEPKENKSGECVQLMTCAADHRCFVWETRSPKGQPDKSAIKSTMGVPDTFRHLDLTWRPFLQIYLQKSEPGGDHQPVRFSMGEKQGDRSALAAATDDKSLKDTTKGEFSVGRPGSGGSKHQRTLQTVKTHLFIGTEDGELVYADWMPAKDQDTGKLQTPKPDFYFSIHDGPIVSLLRSPFFRDVILCVGGWTFSIWKEGTSTGPLLHSAPAEKRLTAGCWSPSCPSMFFIAREDGVLDIWDVLDRTHERSLSQPVAAQPITYLSSFTVNSKQELLAFGTTAGVVQVLEIPASLRTPQRNEKESVGAYYDREVKRRAFVSRRWDIREEEKRQMELENKRKAGIAPNVTLTDEELELKMKMEYAAYMEEEANFLRALGLKDD